MNTQEISYALAKQVPDMARGFSIHTSYGDITIEPGWMAERIAQHLQRVLECELLEQPTATPPSAATVRVSLSGQAAVDWFDSYVADKLADDGRDAQGFRLDQGLIGEFADLDERHPTQPPCSEADGGQRAAPESQPPCGPAQPPATPGTDGGHQ